MVDNKQAMYHFLQWYGSKTLGMVTAVSSTRFSTPDEVIFNNILSFPTSKTLFWLHEN
jgi:hypothetical protein